MSLYNNPKEYAKETMMSIEQATLRCEHFKKIQQIMHEAKKCPKCGKHSLGIEGGSYEEGYSDYVYCENDEVVVIENGEELFTDCGFTSDVKEEYEPLNHWYDFDVILSFCFQIKEEGLPETERNIGCTWDEFINKEKKQLEDNT
ncbi:hypothetical protein MZM54_04890 [[Brevibacterium] frigoritolerans]|nr:hypothetical protein [Peribacillus frigoritolerans]